MAVMIAALAAREAAAMTTLSHQSAWLSICTETITTPVAMYAQSGAQRADGPSQ
jgi:hypothetical protein